MDIGEKIRMACGKINISESELARRIDTTPQNLHQRIKVGKFTPDELEKMAEALGAEFVLQFKFKDGTVV